jgi:hypothetical protein
MYHGGKLAIIFSVSGLLGEIAFVPPADFLKCLQGVLGQLVGIAHDKTPRIIRKSVKVELGSLPRGITRRTDPLYIVGGSEILIHRPAVTRGTQLVWYFRCPGRGSVLALRSAAKKLRHRL